MHSFPQNVLPDFAEHTLCTFHIKEYNGEIVYLDCYTLHVYLNWSNWTLNTAVQELDR